MKVKRLYPIAALLTVAMTATVAAEDPQPPIPQSMATTRGCRDGGIRHPLYKIDPSWVSAAADNAPRVAEGIIRESHVSTEDNPAFHVSHDWNGDVLLEPSYNGLNSDGNNVVNEERLIEIEWESAFFPADFWPVPGDTAWIFGRWIFDCAHPEIAYRTEIHPPKAVAFTRAEPVIFPGDQRPSNSYVTRMFIQGHGGYIRSRIDRQNYVVEVPLPPKPGPLSSLRTAVLSLPFGGPQPTFALVPNLKSPKLQITYPLSTVIDLYNTKKFGAVIATGWQSNAVAQNTPGYRLLRVTFDAIKINSDHDIRSAKWRLWVRADSHWLEIQGLDAVNDGDTIAINRSVDLIVPDNGKLEIETTGWEDDCDGQFRSSEENIRLWNASIGDLKCEKNGNDRIGVAEAKYDAANRFGVGIPQSALSKGSGDANGDFNLSYHIAVLKRFEPGGSVLNSSPPTN